MVIKKLGDIARKQIEGDTEMENEKRLEVAKNMLSATKVEDKKRLLTISNDLYEIANGIVGEPKAETYQERVQNEQKELDQKIKKLVEFMHSNTYAKLKAVEQGLLMVQLASMQSYDVALTRRIELF